MENKSESTATCIVRVILWSSVLSINRDFEALRRLGRADYVREKTELDERPVLDIFESRRFSAAADSFVQHALNEWIHKYI